MLFEFNTNIYDNKSDETFEIDEGFVKGNLFKDEYIGYKDYKPAKITVKNEREALLIKIMILSNLFLFLSLFFSVTYVKFVEARSNISLTEISQCESLLINASSAFN